MMTVKVCNDAMVMHLSYIDKRKYCNRYTPHLLYSPLDTSGNNNDHNGTMMGPSLEGRYHHDRHLMSQLGAKVESGAGWFILVE